MIVRLLWRLFCWLGLKFFPIQVIYSPGEAPARVRLIVFAASTFHVQQFCQEFLEAGVLQLKGEEGDAQGVPRDGE